MSTLLELLSVKPSDVFPYELLSYGRYRYEREWASILHSHPHTEILYVLNGKGYFETNDGKTEIAKGALVLTNPGCLHTEFSSETAPLEYAVFSLKSLAFSLQNSNGETSISLHGDDTKKDYFIFDFSKQHQKVDEILRAIDYEAQKKRTYWQSACAAEFNRFLILLLRTARLSTAPTKETEKQNVATFAKEYIHHHYTQDITLEGLAQVFYVNKYYLAHAFKKEFSESPIQYLNRLRCEKGRLLLTSTDHSVAEISGSVGFSSAPYFSYVYKRFYGESPQQTRKNAHKK